MDCRASPQARTHGDDHPRRYSDAVSNSPDLPLLAALRERVVVADGAMGTMLQAADCDIETDFQGHEGCNEILSITRPDVIRGIHDAYFEVGCDAVETNTFGSNYANLAEYGIPERIGETALAGARIAREAADAWSTPDRPRWVLGSVGPGTKLPTLGHAPYALLRDAYQQQCEAMIEGGVDAVLIETSQDLLQTKSAIVGAKRAMTATGRRVALIAQVTVELTGTMLLGSEIGAALTALEPLGIDVIGMNCATGPAEMSEHLRYLSQHATVPLSVMPNAGLPLLGKSGAEYPLQPVELADALEDFATQYGVGLVGGCCGTTPEHLRHVVERVRARAVAPRTPVVEAGAASLYAAVPFRQDAGVLMVGERTNTNGSKAFRDAMLDADWEKVVDIGREAVREGAHVIDLCVDYVGRDGAIDMRRRRVASGHCVHTADHARLDRAAGDRGGPGVPGRPRGHQQRQLRGRRRTRVALRPGDADRARARRGGRRALHRRGGPGPHSGVEAGGGRAAHRHPHGPVGDARERHPHRHPHLHPRHRQEESRKDGEATIEAIRRLSASHPQVQTTLGLSNISFGLKPAVRVVLNSVFLHECQKAGLTSAIVHASKIVPMNRIPDEQRECALDLIYDRRRPDDHEDGGYDPLTALLDMFEGVEAAGGGKSRVELLLELPLEERLQRRIIDGEKNGLEADLDAAMAQGASRSRSSTTRCCPA